MPTMKLRPARPDLIVRDPVTGAALPPKGKAVKIDAYWQRRLNVGDAVEATAKAKTTDKAED